jgi:hypothetical protein
MPKDKLSFLTKEEIERIDNLRLGFKQFGYDNLSISRVYSEENRSYIINMDVSSKFNEINLSRMYDKTDYTHCNLLRLTVNDLIRDGHAVLFRMRRAEELKLNFSDPISYHSTPLYRE